MAAMVVAWPCPWNIETYHRAGRSVPAPPSVCPDCRAQLRPYSGYWRQFRHRGQRLRWRLWIHRVFCRRCERSHALLPDFVVRHHLDPAETIASAVTGQHDELLPTSTVAGWRRRWRATHNDLVAGVSAALVVFSGVAPSGPAAGSLPELTAAL